MDVTYTFIMPDGTKRTFSVDTQRQFDNDQDLSDAPEWAKLEYHKCPNCPLDPAKSSHCPAALDINGVAGEFGDIVSYATVTVEVETEARKYVTTTDTQTALVALHGLMMATSGCPVLSTFRGLAQTHLPFSTYEESLLRTVGAYLIKQFLAFKSGEEPDLELNGLKSLYEELGIVNTSLKNRIYGASSQDSNINAVNALFSLSALVQLSLEEQLEELKDYL